jgi:hypothetical protein
VGKRYLYLWCDFGCYDVFVCYFYIECFFSVLVDSAVCKFIILLLLCIVFIHSFIHSFCSLSYDRSMATRKVSSPDGAI